jgi:hypothetical protein
MTDNKNEHVVIAVFTSEDGADQATIALKNWEMMNKDVKFGAIGTIYKKRGKVKVKRPREAGEGGRGGVIIGAIAALLSGGVIVIGGFLGGAIGGILGAFVHKSIGLNKEEVQQLGNQLDGGKVAVVVTCDGDKTEGASEVLSRAGGQVKQIQVQDSAAVSTAAAHMDEATAGDDT